MQEYIIRILPKAMADISDVHHYIADELMAPSVADKYIEGIFGKIDSLMFTADIFAVSGREYLQQRYGPGVRTVSYKKMSIVYTVFGDIVLIHRVMPGSLIR
jgi:plasmid stabilization system protein ParE